METFDSVLGRHRGLGPGFDFLRIGLAVSIVAFHACLQTGNVWVRQTPLWFIEYALVPMFFALSGFLVTGSAMRLTLPNFLINRGLRIIPALGVDVLICAMIIGPLLTTLSMYDYFINTQFFEYFINVTGWIHYDLPGVFKDHINTRVNGALWTVPYEMFCYMIMSGLIILRWVAKAARVAALAVALFCAGIAVQKLGYQLPDGLHSVLTFLFVSRGSQLLLAFVIGILTYQIRSFVPYSWMIFIGCCVLCVVASLVLKDGAEEAVGNRIVLIPALVYMTVFLGLTPIPIPKLLHSGDYSYGVYLYHDPLLQVVIAIFPALAAIHTSGAAFVFALGLPAVALLAFFSWHTIEKPILSLRKKFSFVAKVRGVSGEDAPRGPASATGLVAPNET